MRYTEVGSYILVWIALLSMKYTNEYTFLFYSLVFMVCLFLIIKNNSSSNGDKKNGI